jgi:hypothetical protein
MLSKISKFPQQTLHNNPKNLLIGAESPNTNPIANRIVSISSPQEYLGKMTFNPNILDFSISEAILKNKIIIS